MSAQKVKDGDRDEDGADSGGVTVGGGLSPFSIIRRGVTSNKLHLCGHREGSFSQNVEIILKV